jgi:hypothetical protein
MIPADTWVLIGLHLKPRYLSRLLRTCKRVKMLVDNNNYWTRVAAHRIWRTCESMEIEDVASNDDVLPRIEHNLLHMIGLDHGYFWTMELFFRRLDDVIQYYAAHDELMYRPFWEGLKDMSLEQKTRAWMVERCSASAAASGMSCLSLACSQQGNGLMRQRLGCASAVLLGTC